MVLGDSRECLENLIGCEDEEELLKQAIALSMEGADETENGEGENNQQEDGEEREEELLLRQAIALSLEGAEEDDQDEECL